MNPAQPTGSNPQTRFRVESIALLALASLFIVVSHFMVWFEVLNRAVYDGVISRLAAPMLDDVVIVAIDDASLHRYGPWPWPRAQQAELLRAINQHEPAVVAVDIVYAGANGAPSQAATPVAQDAALVSAASEIASLALPMMIEAVGQGRQNVEVLPFPDLLGLTDLVGHVHVELDDDAIVRGTYLYQGVDAPYWPHLMLRIAGVLGREPPAQCPRAPGPPSMLLMKCDYRRLPFAGPPGTYPYVPAHLLLGDAGPLPLAEALKGKVAIVGLTAIGAGDWVTSPTSGDEGPMPGVEFNANLLSAFMHNTLVREPAAWVRISLSLLIVTLCSLLLPRLRPKQMLMTTLALALVPLAITIGALATAWVYIPLASATVAVIFIYPLWSWRRHEIAWEFIQQELTRIDEESRRWQESGLWVAHNAKVDTIEERLSRVVDADVSLAAQEPPPDLGSDAARSLFTSTRTALRHSERVTGGPPGEILAAQIRTLEKRAKSLREGRAMGIAGLGHMANGTMIISALGEVVFANAAATRLLGLSASPEDTDALALLQPIAPPLGQTWIEIMRDVVLNQSPTAFEAQTPDQTPLYVAAQPLDIGDTQAHAPFWVLTLSDLTAIRAAEAQREEALAFLSHDIRSPLMSVLALLRSSDEQSELLEAIGRYTQKGLSTSEQFLQLSRLQLSNRFERYDLQLEQLIDNAIEQVFFLARDKDITIAHVSETPLNDVSPHDEELLNEGIWIEGNGELLERALVNLLGNAIKYSEAGTRITVRSEAEPGIARVAVADQGYGIPADELDHIFEPYYRSAHPELAENRGAGLGLRFVKTVIERHDGVITVHSSRGEGTTFTIELPLADPAAERSGSSEET